MIRSIGSVVRRSTTKVSLTSAFSTEISIQRRDGEKQSLLPPLPTRFLRDADPSNYDAVTHQRNDVPFDNKTGKPLLKDDDQQEAIKYAIRDCNYQDEISTIEWGDGHASQYSEIWSRDTFEKWRGVEDETTPRILWSNMTEAKVRNDASLSLTFSDLLKEGGMKSALKVLYQYGFVLITETPLDDGAGIAALASALSGGSVKERTSYSILANYRNGGKETILPHATEGPLRTLYGSIWWTTSSGQVEGTSVADSAYGKGGLPLHTDMTYHRDPPGLQIFTMVQPALEGGESVYGDGFAAAEYLKVNHPDAFSTLSSVVRAYRCIDDSTGWHLEGRGPVISALENGVVTAIRHNDLDRLPDLPPFGVSPKGADAFYDKLSDAHRKWNDVLSRDEFRLVMSLNPGDTAVVANQRCFHGRYSFRTDDSCPRAVMGCYVSQDELNSRFRYEGFRVFS